MAREKDSRMIRENLVVLLMTEATADFPGGSGTEEDIYQIAIACNLFIGDR